MGRTAPARLIWAPGATQIIGYGSLYYSFSILAPDMAREFSVPSDRLFGLLSATLMVAGMFAAKAGRWADRYGAGRLIVLGSLAAGLSLAVAAAAANAAAANVVVFSAALITMEVSSTFVLYSMAFAAIVQTGAPPGGSAEGLPSTRPRALANDLRLLGFPDRTSQQRRRV